jgi:O-antigen ligase
MTSRVGERPVVGQGDSTWTAGSLLAVTLPALLAFNLPPSATFFNQAASLIGWGLWLTVLTIAAPARVGMLRNGPLAALLTALGLVTAAALASPLWAGLPPSLSMSAAGMLAATALVALTGAAVRHSGRGQAAYTAFCIALVVAGVASTAIGIVQVFAPQWGGGDWIAQSAFNGRAAGNLRQPNHLSTLLLWSAVAVVWLSAVRRIHRAAMIMLGALMVLGLVLSASRTGMVGAILLALWGVLDRRLGRADRACLGAVPIVYAVFWVALSGFGSPGEPAVFGGDKHVFKSDISSERFAIWSDTIALIAAHPWSGVGVGEFNFAWTLTPFPGRPTQFFDHTHNLPLQFAVELGLPLAAAVLALLMWALVGAFQAARQSEAESDRHLRAAFVMVLMMAVHSQLEYPLWYAYFLLPTAFAFGLCLGAPAQEPVAAPPTAAARGTRPLLIAAMLLTIGGIASVIDYWRVVVIFAPPANAAPLSQRILEGRRSWFFGHHADYAAATSVADPSKVMPAFDTATHYLLDTRLMVAWANALNGRGDVELARHIAARLREFRNPASDEFFAVCTATPPGTPLPFQCTPPSKALDYRDFR